MANEVIENPVIQVNGTATIEPSIDVADLVNEESGQVVTTSVKIAEIFGKEHRRVLQTIRELDCSTDFRLHNFVQTLKIRKMPNGASTEDPMFYITRDGFVFLVMGFTGKTAAKFKEAYIKAFNVMEERLRQRKQLEAQTAKPAATRSHYTIADSPAMVKAHTWKRMFGKLTRIKQGDVLMSTKTLADVLDRRHSRVTATIRGILATASDPVAVRSHIREGHYLDRARRKMACYDLTREGMMLYLEKAREIDNDERGALLYAYDQAETKRPYHGGTGQPRQAKPKSGPAQQPQQVATPNLPQNPTDMMQRFVTAMAVMMGVDVNQVSNVINGGNK